MSPPRHAHHRSRGRSAPRANAVGRQCPSCTKGRCGCVARAAGRWWIASSRKAPALAARDCPKRLPTGSALSLAAKWRGGERMTALRAPLRPSLRRFTGAHFRHHSHHKSARRYPDGEACPATWNRLRCTSYLYMLWKFHGTTRIHNLHRSSEIFFSVCDSYGPPRA